ncbi:MAG: hypothetical protein Tsb009_17060 [Planctomycetaceae bacterium]
MLWVSISVYVYAGGAFALMFAYVNNGPYIEAYEYIMYFCVGVHLGMFSYILYRVIKRLCVAKSLSNKNYSAK